MTSFHQKTSQTENLKHFKDSMNDWVIFLGKELREAKLHINELKKAHRAARDGPPNEILAPF